LGQNERILVTMRYIYEQLSARNSAIQFLRKSDGHSSTSVSRKIKPKQTFPLHIKTDRMVIVLNEKGLNSCEDSFISVGTERLIACANLEYTFKQSE
jgi:hypothetical protein